MEFLPAIDDYQPDFLRPNPERVELFKGITFIFLDEGQYNNLVTPINAGLGKALVFEIQGKGVEDLVKFGSNKGKVLLVQRNMDADDTICIEAAKRCVSCGDILTKDWDMKLLPKVVYWNQCCE
jgi:hypothetical protein